MKNWSYSRYSTWKQCPAKLKYQTESKDEQPVHPAAQRGTKIHMGIELYLRAGTNTLIPELDYYRSFFDRLIAQGAQPELPLAVNSRWEPTDWDDPNRWWRGVLDCVVETDDVCITYDWKTGNEYGDHRDQREIYAAAKFAHDNRFKDYIVIHVYLDKKMNTISSFPAKNIPKLQLKWMEKVAPMLSDETLAPNPGYYCRMCHFRRDNSGPCPF